MIVLQHFSLSVLNLNAAFQGWNSQDACLIWVWHVCLGLFSKEPVFEIFEHLLYIWSLSNLRVASCELQVASCKLRVANYAFNACKLQYTLKIYSGKQSL